MLIRKGIPREELLAASLITPSCGLGSLTPELAKKILTLTAGVSEAMRERYL